MISSSRSFFAKCLALGVVISIYTTTFATIEYKSTGPSNSRMLLDRIESHIAHSELIWLELPPLPKKDVTVAHLQRRIDALKAKLQGFEKEGLAFDTMKLFDDMRTVDKMLENHNSAPARHRFWLAIIISNIAFLIVVFVTTVLACRGRLV